MIRADHDDDDWEEDEPLATGYASSQDAHKRSRLWDLKSTSKAACAAADRGRPRRRIGFLS